jgi:predicted metalloprotease with PDZ domain
MAACASLRAAAAAALLLIPARALAQRPVEYEIAFPNAVHHEAEVTVTFPDLPAGALEVRMSRASPGRYALHEFAKNVYAVRATDGAGRDLALSRPDPYGWSVAGHDGTVRLHYTLYADYADGTYSGVDATHAHLNMPATFAWARGLDARPIAIVFHSPNPAWKIATQLFPTADSARFTAPGLQYFMDSPTEMSDFTPRSFTVASRGKRYPIRLALHHQGTAAEADAYLETLRKVVMEEIAVFGETPRYDVGRYTFIADFLPWVEGDGMEHRNSTILTTSEPLSSATANHLEAASHEFFHSWNVERIRPRSLEPFDFERANMSGELWFAEGFTQYYTPLFPRRAGLTSDAQLAQALGGVVDEVVNAPGRRLFSAVEMSEQAPFVDAAASIDPQNRTNTFISYYTWGAAIGLGLDLTLRERYDLTLDDYMRAVWKAYGEPERAYTVADLRATLAALTRDPAFADDFFRRYVEGREVVDYAALLSGAGFLVRRAQPGAAWLGEPRLTFGPGGVTLARATRVGTPLYEAGLDRGDRILSLGGEAIASAAALSALLARHRPGDAIAAEVEQRGARRMATVTLRENPALQVVTYEDAGMRPTPVMLALRARWLGSRAAETIGK